MSDSPWKVQLSRTAKKQYAKLSKSGQKNPSIIDIIDRLIVQLKISGPELKDWSNYGKLGRYKYHCHLKKGQPTYVACWEVIDDKKKLIEVSYVDTHEGAPY